MEQKDVELASLRSQRDEAERQHSAQLMTLQMEVTD